MQEKIYEVVGDNIKVSDLGDKMEVIEDLKAQITMIDGAIENYQNSTNQAIESKTKLEAILLSLE